MLPASLRETQTTVKSTALFTLNAESGTIMIMCGVFVFVICVMKFCDCVYFLFL